MARSIRDRELHELARKAAEATGETMTPAFKTALGERLQRLAAASAEDQERRALAVLGLREGVVPCPCSTRARRRR